MNAKKLAALLKKETFCACHHEHTTYLATDRWAVIAHKTRLVDLLPPHMQAKDGASDGGPAPLAMRLKLDEYLAAPAAPATDTHLSLRAPIGTLRILSTKRGWAFVPDRQMAAALDDIPRGWTFHIACDGPEKPVIIREEGDGDTVTTLIMPMFPDYIPLEPLSYLRQRKEKKA
jgi:hypothetical protein